MHTAGPIGRQAELTALQALAGRVREQRRAAVATVIGEAGIGKTTLMRSLRALLVDDGFCVLEASVSAAETPLAWVGVHGLLASPAVEPELASLPKPQREAMLGALGRRSIEVNAGLIGLGLGGVFTALAARGPVAVLVDDLHWLDAATAGALSFAVRLSEAAPVLTVLAARPDLDLPVEGHRLLDPDSTMRVELAGLSPAGIHQLLVQTCGVTVRRPDLIRLHEFTAGNPLQVVEAGRLLAQGRTLDEALLPPSIQAAIAARLRELPAPTRRALEAAALAAVPTVSLVQRALPEVEVEGSLLAAEDAGVIDVVGDTISFRHPLLRAGVLDDLAGVRRRRLLQRLADEVSDPDEKALLLADASSAPNEAVADAMEQAAMRASTRGVPLLAAERFRRAADCSVHPQAQARRLLLAAEAAFAGGDPAGVLEPAEAAYRLSDDPEIRLRAGHCAVLALAATDELGRAHARAEALFHDVEGDRGREARVLRIIARIRAFDDLDAAQAAIERAAEAAASTNVDEVIANVTVVAALIGQLRGDPVDVDEIAALAESSMSSASLPARSLLLELFTWTDRVDEALELGQAQFAEAEAIGSIDDMGAIRDQLADACFRAGRWDDAVALVRATLEADRIAMTKGPADCRPADLAQTLAAQGLDEEASALLVPVLERSGLAPVIRLQRATRAGFVHLAAERWPEAAAHLCDARREAIALKQGDLGSIPFRADLVEALVALGSLQEAADVVEEHRALAQRSGLPRGLAESARTLGLLEAARGNQAAAVAAFEHALQIHQHWPVPFEHGRTLLALGATLRRAGRRAQAAARFDQAAAIFRQLGARPWLERVEDERTRLGTRRSTTHELTATERRIADLVAQGRSNAEIAATVMVSVRTVESNLTRVYRKLGVRSRTELAVSLRDGT